MESDNLFAVSVLVIIVWSVIIYSIIKSASKSKEIEHQLKMQTLLLAKMAQKAEVSDEEVSAILNVKK